MASEFILVVHPASLLALNGVDGVLGRASGRVPFGCQIPPLSRFCRIHQCGQAETSLGHE
jgi:hypothetical protein